MSELRSQLQRVGGVAQRYLRAARLAEPLPLLLIVAPLLGALLMATSGKPTIAPLLLLPLAALATWGLGGALTTLLDERNDLLGEAPLPSRPHLIRFTISLLVLALLCYGLLGIATLALGTLPLLIALSYPWLRRRTYLIEGWLGLGSACTVTLAYAGTQQWLDKTAALLAVVTLCWATGWWVLHAWPRQLELAERGVRTLGLMFGPATGHLVIALQVAMLLGGWMAAGQAPFGALFSWALLASALGVAGQGWLFYTQGSRGAATSLLVHLLSGTVLWLGVALHFLTTAA